MNIGILTFHYALNYGAVLQCWSLKYHLEKLGHNVVVIDRIPNNDSNLRVWIGDLKTRLWPNKEVISWEKFRLEARMLIGKKTKRYANSKSMKNVQKYNFDYIIVGSDQIWRDIYTLADDNYFLDFLPATSKTKRISYAASFGTDTWKGSQDRIMKLKKCLNRFDAISVRETSGIDICQEIFNVKAIHVLDPTLLLKQEDYLSYFKLPISQTQEDCIVSYFLGPAKERDASVSYINKWSIKHGFHYLDLYKPNEETKKHYTVTEWLGQIFHAKYIVTNSFHATVFAILAHKNFATVDLVSGGSSRLYSLLSMLGMEDRLVNNIEEIERVLSIPLNVASVESVLRKKREGSFTFLKHSGL